MSSFKSISSIQAQNLIKDSKDLIIIDVRRYSEFKEKKIHNAINIPVEELEWEIEELKESKDKPILVYCKAGHKSALACQMLEEEGFTPGVNEVLEQIQQNAQGNVDSACGQELSECRAPAHGVNEESRKGIRRKRTRCLRQEGCKNEKQEPFIQFPKLFYGPL